MLDHISLGVSDLDRAVAFYDAVLGAIGYVRLWRQAGGAGYGALGGNDRLALFERPTAAPPGAGWHLALTAPSRESVEAFHQLALGNGGSDCGAPGLRPNYGTTYFACFVVDPDGYRLEAVHQ